MDRRHRWRRRFWTKTGKEDEYYEHESFRVAVLGNVCRGGKKRPDRMVPWNANNIWNIFNIVSSPGRRRRRWWCCCLGSLLPKNGTVADHLLGLCACKGVNSFHRILCKLFWSCLIQIEIYSRVILKKPPHTFSFHWHTAKATMNGNTSKTEHRGAAEKRKNWIETRGFQWWMGREKIIIISSSC